MDGLRALGYVIGESVLVDARAPQQNTIEEYSALASQLVATGVDVLVAANPQALEVMTKATRAIPIVGVDLESDPAAKGWVASLARPGGNVTGFFLDIPEMSGKQRQLLKEVKPTLARVAVLGDGAVNELQFRAAEGATQAGRGIALQLLPIKTQAEVPGAIAEAARQRAGALLVLTSPLFFAKLRCRQGRGQAPGFPRSISLCRSSPRRVDFSPTAPTSEISFGAPRYVDISKCVGRVNCSRVFIG